MCIVVVCRAERGRRRSVFAQAVLSAKLIHAGGGPGLSGLPQLARLIDTRVNGRAHRALAAGQVQAVLG